MKIVEEESQIIKIAKEKSQTMKIVEKESQTIKIVDEESQTKTPDLTVSHVFDSFMNQTSCI